MRLAVGTALGERVEVVSVAAGEARVQTGDLGTLVSIADGLAHVLFDSGDEIAVDPEVVRLRPALRRTA